MKIEHIIDVLMEKQPGVGQFVFECDCLDCKKKTEVVISLEIGEEPGTVECRITGGAAYGFDPENPVFFSSVRCDECFAKHGETIVYSRVVGYLSPVRNWNIGKAAEFEKRKMFDRSVTVGAGE
jgi:hypothetical protein